MNLGMGDVSILAVLGYGVVFFGLTLLMLVVMAMCKAFDAKANK
ncbi:MAG: OadG family protein [Clostridia bacterium]|nr:OadG family protein [Clostridia bacterium]